MHLFIRFQSAGLLKQLPIEPDPTTEALMMRFRLDNKILMKKIAVNREIGIQRRKVQRQNVLKCSKRHPLFTHAAVTTQTSWHSYEFLTSFKAGGLLG